MFDKFGEFNSYEEINRAAEAQRAEGDLEALQALAEENGLDPEDAEDFFDGISTNFCVARNAALGKLRIEKTDMKLEREFLLLEEELEKACMEDPAVAAGVRRKGKSLAGYMAKIIDKGYEDAVAPPKAILDKVTAVPSQYRQHMKTGMPDKRCRTEIMKAYYCGEVAE